MHQGYVPSLYFVIDVVTELARDDVLCELLHFHDLFLMSETVTELRKFKK